MKTGVLIHGCNLHVENWRHVAWGDPPDQLGRVPQGILTALEFDATVIVLGTGASRKEFVWDTAEETGPVLLEAEYTLEYLRRALDDLLAFAPLAKFFEDEPSERIRQRLQQLLERIVLDCNSQNTLEEVEQAGRLMGQQGCERMILVSSPTHVIRCLRDANRLVDERPEFAQWRGRIFANPSVTSYEGTRPGDVVVVEPPHRPDRHMIPTHRRIQRMLDLQRLPATDQMELIQAFDDLLQRYEHRAITRRATPAPGKPED
jgi:hypothetical protein